MKIAEQKIKELNELGIKNGSAIIGKNFKSNVTLISDLRFDIESDDTFSIVADVLCDGEKIEDFIILTENEIQVEITSSRNN